MRLSDLLSLYDPSPVWYRRDSWTEGHIEVNSRGEMWWKRFPTDHGWRWMPKATDLVALDWCLFMPIEKDVPRGT